MSFSLIPRKVLQTNSPISGQITVEEQLGKYSLSVQGLTQSGGLIKSIWCKPISRLTHHVSRITDVLILGLGGGSVVQLIAKKWPQAKITGLEIDPKIIKISQKYFKLNEFKNLKTINADAFDWLKTPRRSPFDFAQGTIRGVSSKTPPRCCEATPRGWDLIIIDLYCGYEFPKQAESQVFLTQLKKILFSDGIVIFNRLRVSHTRCDIGRHFGDTAFFEENLNKVFGQINIVKTRTNWFFSCQK